MTVSRVRYAHTPRGVPIAFIARGDGPPLLVVENLGVSSNSLAMSDVGFITRLADARTVVTFDFPGTGLSDAGPVDLSLGAQVGCMAAVAGELGAGPVDVYGWGLSAAPATAFAARWPSLVRRLVLANPCVDARELDGDSPLFRLLRLSTEDYGFFVTTLLSLLGVPGHRQPPLHQTLLRGAPTAVLPAWVESMSTFDASEELEKVQSPTLVIQPRDHPLLSPHHATSIAARIPAATLVRVDTAPMGGMLAENRDLVLDFLDQGAPEPVTVRRASAGTVLKIIVFTDVEDHTQMMERLGDEKGREVLREHERLTRQTIRRNGGSLVKALGDGFMASFDSVQRALAFATELQRTLSKKPGEPVRVRIGVNAGEPVSEDDDFFGTAVIVAARLAAEAHGGKILVSNVVRELASGKGFEFSDRGTVALKGIEEPARVFELRWWE
ncbi:MAG: adenylate/guanylate cyclase domain-containing protein [Chloroflexi bacterium]|nr:adenylate/guanylate cyclase domain-containing protein [Chloroflexota bacterium]